LFFSSALFFFSYFWWGQVFLFSRSSFLGELFVLVFGPHPAGVRCFFFQPPAPQRIFSLLDQHPTIFFAFTPCGCFFFCCTVWNNFTILPPPAEFLGACRSFESCVSASFGNLPRVGGDLAPMPHPAQPPSKGFSYGTAYL